MFTLLQHEKFFKKNIETHPFNSMLNNEKTFFFGMIFGYKENDDFRLMSQNNDFKLWRNMCIKNKINYRIIKDTDKKIDTEYFKKQFIKLFKICLKNLTNLCIILISGHGETKNENFYLLMEEKNELKNELKNVNITQLFLEIIKESENVLQMSKLKILFLFDTCYSINPLQLKYELINPEPNIKIRDAFYNYCFDNVTNNLNIWCVGANKGLSSLKFEDGKYVSEFTDQIFKLNTFNEETIVDSLKKIKSIHPDTTIFFSKLYKV